MFSMFATGFVWGLGILAAGAFVRFIVLPILNNGAWIEFIQEIKDDLQDRENVDKGKTIEVEGEVVNSQPEAAYGRKRG